MFDHDMKTREKDELQGKVKTFVFFKRLQRTIKHVERVLQITSHADGKTGDQDFVFSCGTHYSS